MTNRFDILTIGHSNHGIGRFCEMLRENDVLTVVDVRSTPFSRFQPQFSSKAFSAALTSRDLAYAWLGKELGGRPPADRLYAADGSADYVAMSLEPAYHDGIAEVLRLARSGPVCLVCSERDPLECHRCLMVGRTLAGKGMSLGHIHFDGKVEDQASLEDRLLRKVGSTSGDLFELGGDRLARAYIDLTKKIAFRKRDSMSTPNGLSQNPEAMRERGNDDLDPGGPTGPR